MPKATWQFVLVFAAVVTLQSCCRHNCYADYVLAFHGPGCVPCQRMEPIEKQLRDEGLDIRTVDASERKDLAEHYKITRWPQYVYVCESGGKSYDSGRRIVGQTTVGRLRRFADSGVVRNLIRTFFWPFTVTP